MSWNDDSALWLTEDVMSFTMRTHRLGAEMVGPPSPFSSLGASAWTEPFMIRWMHFLRSVSSHLFVFVRLGRIQRFPST